MLVPFFLKLPSESIYPSDRKVWPSLHSWIFFFCIPWRRPWSRISKRLLVKKCELESTDVTSSRIVKMKKNQQIPPFNKILIRSRLGLARFKFDFFLEGIFLR